MKKSSETHSHEGLTDELEVGQVMEVPEGSSLEEQLIRTIITSYQDAYNKYNDKNEVRYWLTITQHKIATPDGNKDVAYLRIERGIKPKGGTEEEWSNQLIHQEIYYFSGIKERINPKAIWKKQLFMNALARLCQAGLEYAELLKKMKAIKDAEPQPKESNIEVTNQMPAPLTKDDEEYKHWLKAEREKEGIK